MSTPWVDDSRATQSAILAALTLDQRTTLLEEACARIEASLNRKVLAADYAEVLDGMGDKLLIVRNPPINTLTSVVIEYADDILSTTTLDETQLKLQRDDGIIHIRQTAAYCFPLGKQNVTVNYNGGWTTGAIPRDLITVAIQFAIAGATDQNRDARVTNESLGDWSQSYNSIVGDQAKTIETILSRYRLEAVA